MPRKKREPFADANSLNKKVYGGPSVLSQFVDVDFDPYKTVPIYESPVDADFPALSLLKLPDSDVETVETVSPAEPVSLEYRIIGLTWHTPEFMNTCHIDSFLSAFARVCRQTHGRFLNKLKRLDPVGRVLLQIGEHVLNAKNMIDSAYVKKLWLDVVSSEPVIAPFDAKGLEQFSVFQHLYDHSGVSIECACKCGPQFEPEPVIRGRNIRDINNLLLNYRGYNPITPWCAKCQLHRDFVRLKPVETNWLLTILYLGDESPDFDEFLPVIEIDRKMYKLAYLGYKIEAAYTGENIGHVISVQNIRGAWYMYDGIKRPSFVLCENQKYMTELGAKLQSIVYFSI